MTKSKRLLIPAAKRTLLGGGVSLLALAIGASSALAQGTYDTDAQEIVVTGFKKSLEDALETKRAAADFVEVISAEDLGKLPDESIADSIARLPGLAAQRNNSGRDQDISVRGLPPAMNATLLNGREQTSTSNNRDVQYDQYPAELMNQVIVYKSGDASLIGAGISTIDLRTIRPLDYGKFGLTVGAKGQYDTRGQLNAGTSPWGNRENITYVDQFAHDTIGVLFGYAHSDSPNQILSQHAWGFSGDSSLPGNGGGLQNWIQSENLERDGYAATVQWKPNDKFEWTTDGFYSRYNDNTVTRGLEGPISGAVATGNTESFNWVPQLENYDYKEKDALKSIGTNFKYKIADSWHTDVDLNYNSAFRKMPQIELSSGLNTNGTQNVVPVTITANGTNGGLITGSGQNFSNPNVFALGENQNWQNFYPANWNNANGQFNKAGTAVWKQFTTKDTIKAARWDVSHDLDNGYLSEVSAGFNYSDRQKSYLHEEGVAYLNSLNPAMTVPAGLLASPTNLSAFGFGNVLSIDPVKAYDSGLYTFGTRYDNSKDNWFIEEKVETAYVKADIDTHLFGRELTGNVGTQWVHTNQSTLQFAENGGWSNYTFVPTTGGTAYSDFLPSLNLTYHLDPQEDVRFGVGRSMARARLDNIAGGYVVTYTAANANSTTQSPWNATSGNAKLKPWISDDVDLSYTRTFDKGAYISLAGYYKNLESFVYDGVQIISFANQIPQGTTAPLINLGPSSSYQNGTGGSIYGSELSGNLPFEKFTPILTGFGLEANVSVNISSVNIPITATNTSPNGQIPELSKWTASATLYYQYEGFEARINDRYRSKYVQEVPNYDGSLQNIEGTAENIVDVQLSYSWDTGELKGLSTTFSAQNITDAPQNSYYAGHPNQSDYYKLYGTSILFGVSYKM
jgi:iron complex outermembrane receptor protein